MQNKSFDPNQLQTLLSKISEGFAYCKIITDEAGKPVDWLFLDINEVYEKINSIQKQAVVGKRATEVLPHIKKDSVDWVNLFGSVALTGKSLVTERYVEGRKKWYHISAYSPQKNHFIAIFQDITERKLAEEAIQENEERFASAFHVSPVAMTIACLPQGIWTDVNDSFLKLTGYTREEVVGHTSADLRMFESSQKDRELLISRLLTQRSVTNAEISARTKDGKILKLLFSGVVVNIKGQEYAIAMQTDITERKKAEEALRENEQKYRGLFTNMIDGFAYCKMVYDDDGRPADFIYLEVNDAFEKLTGLKKETVLNRKVSEAIPGTRDANPEIIETYGRVAATGREERFEVFFKPLNTWFLISVYSPQKGYFVALFENITGRKKDEEKLNRNNQRLELLSSITSQLLSSANPQTAVKEISDRLLKFMNCDLYFFFLVDEQRGKLHLNAYSGAPPEAAKTFEWLSLGRMDCDCTTQRDNGIACENMHDTQDDRTAIVKSLGVKAYCANPILYNGKVIGTLSFGSKKETSFSSEDLSLMQTVTAEISVAIARKRAEEALLESRQRWSTTLSSVGDAVIATDLEGKITFMNPVAEQLTGWLLSQAKEKPIKQVFKIINEHTRREVENPVTRVLEKGLIVSLANHTILVRQDGTEVPIDDSGAPIKTENGEIRGVVLVFRDIAERKKIEQKLERQAALIDLSPDAIIMKNLDGTITFWSRGAEKLYGWTKHEALGKSTHSLFQTRLPEPLGDIINKLKVEKRWSGELGHRTKDGREVVVQSWWLAEKTEHGEITSILESNVDLTERKMVEQEIAQAKQRLDAHMNNSPEAVIEFDPQFRVTRWSKEATRIFGWLAEEIIGKSILEMPWVYKDDVAIVQQVSADMLSGKSPSNISHNRNYRKDGSVIDCEWYNSAIYDSKGKLVSILSQVLDITERKRAEREVARLASFPMLNPSPVIEVNFDGKLTYVNPATKTFFPQLEKEGLNNVFFQDWDNITKAFAERATNTFGREIKISGHWYHQQFYLAPQSQNIRIYSTDVDELKQSEEARARAQAKLEENAVLLEEYASQMEELAEQRAQQLQNAERMVAIGQTASMVGHDIRNPLQAITSDMYIIAEETKALQDDECKQAIIESVESVNQNISYINKIVSDLQDYTRPLKPNLREINLHEIIEGTLLTIYFPKEIEVTVDIKENAKPIKTDIDYLRRILTNLFTNAVQAMPAGGKLTIKAAKKKAAINISVQDTGVGIPVEARTKMFTPLFTTKSKGQGLGLAVVKRIVESLGGTITFESQENQGTKFIVELPQK